MSEPPPLNLDYSFAGAEIAALLGGRCSLDFIGICSEAGFETDKPHLRALVRLGLQPHETLTPAEYLGICEILLKHFYDIGISRQNIYLSDAFKTYYLEPDLSVTHSLPASQLAYQQFLQLDLGPLPPGNDVQDPRDPREYDPARGHLDQQAQTEPSDAGPGPDPKHPFRFRWRLDQKGFYFPWDVAPDEEAP